ncbi:hypothetical protein BZG21_47010, partial [Escherichia coli]|nr:hypothetical protein [Escherichia coli]
SFEDAMELEDELVDRFGDLPEAVINLMAVARLKVYGKTYGIESITRRGDDLTIKFYEGREHAFELSKIANIGNQFERRVQFEQGSHMLVHVKGKGLEDKQLMELVEKFMESLQSAFKSKGEPKNVTKV